MTTTTSVPTATSNSKSKSDNNNIITTDNTANATTATATTTTINNNNNNNNNIIPLECANANSAITCNTESNRNKTQQSMQQSSLAAATATTLAVAATATSAVAATVTAATTSSAAAPALASSTTPTSTGTLATVAAAVTPSSTLTPPLAHRAVTITPILNPAVSLANQQNFTRTMQTDEDFNIRFVNLVRLHKCLYDKKVPEYRNRDNQEKAWLQISLETKESVIHCKERWRNLRACLSRYIKQQTGNDPQHKPYYLTEHMAFLLPFLKSTRNSLDGNNTLATLFQFSQQQQQHVPQQNNSISTTLQIMAQPHLKFNEQPPLELKHSLSDNEDEETIDAFDPAITASLHMHHQHHHHHHQQQQHGASSPPLSDTASANTMQNFIPDVQLSEMRTPDGVVQDIAYVNTHLRRDSTAMQQQHQHLQQDHHDQFGHEPKRIKTECHASEATTTAQLHMYAGEHADMEFFRSILPDIAALTPHQKRKLKIGILELIDDVVERYPLERSTNTNVTSQNNANASGGKSIRRNSSRDWRK